MLPEDVPEIKLNRAAAAATGTPAADSAAKDDGVGVWKDVKDFREEEIGSPLPGAPA